MSASARKLTIAGLVPAILALTQAAAYAIQARAEYPLDTLSPKSDITRWFTSIF